MKVMVIFRRSSVGGAELARWLAEGFAAAGWTVEQGDLDAVMPGRLAGASPVARRQPAVEGLIDHLSQVDLVVLASDRVVFADRGGPDLARLAGWAGAAAVPVIAVGAQADLSTREARGLGVEAVYAAGSAEAVPLIVATWTPR